MATVQTETQSQIHYSQITTTPYEVNAKIRQGVKVYSLNDEFESKPLPRYEASWIPNAYLSNLFGDELLHKIPNIEITSGATDYLDLVKPTDFPNTCMAKGVDPFKRPFVSFGFHVEFAADVERTIYTLFKRYSEENSQFVICKSHYSGDGSYMNAVFNNSISVNNDVYNTLKQLIDNYVNGNTGVTFEREVYNSKIHDYSKNIFTVKMYNPNE